MSFDSFNSLQYSCGKCGQEEDDDESEYLDHLSDDDENNETPAQKIDRTIKLH